MQFKREKYLKQLIERMHNGEIKVNGAILYDEDLKEFRSSASVLGDKDFLVRLSSKAGRLFLRPGRPAKENNLIANT